MQYRAITLSLKNKHNWNPLAHSRTRAQNSSAHDYSTVASINQLDAAHKRKPQETNKERKLIILILFIFPFLNYCGLPVLELSLKVYHIMAISMHALQ